MEDFDKSIYGGAKILKTVIRFFEYLTKYLEY